MNDDERLGKIVQIYQYHFGQEAETVYDCGTRDGDDAHFLATKLKAKNVICVDANPLAVETTRKNYPDFHVIETALSDFNGHSTFYQIVSDRKDFAGSSSLTNVGAWYGAEVNPITVPVARMDTLIQELELPIPDVIKVDLEGYTYEFLQGLGKYLSSVKVLHLETETYTRHFGHKDSDTIKSVMRDAGFELEDVSYEWGPTIEDQVWVNRAIE
jgi:FkbM family methyltransferase